MRGIFGSAAAAAAVRTYSFIHVDVVTVVGVDVSVCGLDAAGASLPTVWLEDERFGTFVLVILARVVACLAVEVKKEGVKSQPLELLSRKASFSTGLRPLWKCKPALNAETHTGG